MGQAWARNLSAHPEVEIAGWLDVRPGAADDAVKKLQLDVPVLGTDLVKGMDQAKPDFVVDVTSPDAHRDVVVTALSHGFPVIGEKPMATSLGEAREMIAASEKAEKLYMVSQSRRYDSGIAAYRKLIHDQIGAPGILNVDFYIGAHFGGFRDEMDSPLVLDMAIHTFDQARFLSESDPVSVYAEEFNPSWSWYRGDACATALFQMSDGLKFCYRGSWCADGLMTSWEGDWRAVSGEGTALWPGRGEPFAEIVKNSDGFHREVNRVEQAREDLASGISGSLQEFVNALNTGTTPQGECHDNFKSLAMVFGAIESSRQGRRIQIETL
jgi:predicted dehydrogenase